MLLRRQRAALDLDSTSPESQPTTSRFARLRRVRSSLDLDAAKPESRRASARLLPLVGPPASLGRPAGPCGRSGAGPGPESRSRNLDDPERTGACCCGVAQTRGGDGAVPDAVMLTAVTHQGIQEARKMSFKRLLLLSAIPASLIPFAACGVRTEPAVQIRFVRPSAGASVPGGAPLTFSVSTTGTGGSPATGTLAAYMISVPGSNPPWAKLAATSAGTSALRTITIPSASLFPAGCYYSSATSTCYNVLLMLVPRGKPVPPGGYRQRLGSLYRILPLSPNPAAPPYPFARVSLVIASSGSATGA